MEGLMTQEVMPRLRAHFELPTTLYETVVTAGIGESSLAALVASWEDGLPEKGVSLAYLPSPGQVKMRLGVHGPATDRTKLEALIASETETLLELIGPHAVGRGNIDIAGAVLKLLEAHGQSVATAESCTGGTVAQMLTAVPGASASYLGSVVAYDNRVKHEVLGVPESAFDDHGAVSEAVVLAMAEGVRQRLGTTWGVATSGVAGPSGGTEEKPVGMVWMAVAGPYGAKAWVHRFGSQRARIVQRASRRILTHLHQEVKNQAASALEE
jgi:nicotinamide-nucleotide amidase